jgi:hypothetical protein
MHYTGVIFWKAISPSSVFAMYSSFSSNSLERDQVTITATELPDEGHPFHNGAIKSIISRAPAVF